MYHRKRKSSTRGEPSFFYKKSKKNEGINTFGTFYRHLTGDPGGSSLVSYDTKQTTEQETPLTFSWSVIFLPSAHDSFPTVIIWDLSYSMTVSSMTVDRP